MRWHTKETADDRWAREHPYGEQGSVDYWIEVMNRAYELGETRAASERDKLVALTGPQPPMEWSSFPSWFGDLWISHLASWNRDSRLAMPY